MTIHEFYAISIPAMKDFEPAHINFALFKDDARPRTCTLALWGLGNPENSLRDTISFTSDGLEFATDGEGERLVSIIEDENKELPYVKHFAKKATAVLFAVAHSFIEATMKDVDNWRDDKENMPSGFFSIVFSPYGYNAFIISSDYVQDLIDKGDSDKDPIKELIGDGSFCGVVPDSVVLPKDLFQTVEGAVSNEEGLQINEESLTMHLADVNVILGQPGSGKTYLHSYLHNSLRDSNAPQQAIRIPTVTPVLFENLFIKDDEDSFMYPECKGIYESLMPYASESGDTANLFNFIRLLIKSGRFIPGGSLFMECPENNLSIKARKDFVELLVRIAKEMKRKVIITTNSSYILNHFLIAALEKEEISLNVFKTIKEDGKHYIQNFSVKALPELMWNAPEVFN